MKILMVCLGNICRSPLAEGILQHKVIKAGLLWQVESAGTANYHVGEPPHKLSQKVAKMNGIDISRQQCRQFKKEDMLEFDKIYAMDSENYINIKHISGDLWKYDPTNAVQAPRATIRIWLLAMLVSACVPLSWLPWRFSLRTLLIATALVAVVLGLIVWTSR